MEKQKIVGRQSELARIAELKLSNAPAFVAVYGREKVSGTVYWRFGGCGYNPVMGRPNRAADGGLIFHILNRGNARFTISGKPGEEAKRFLTPFFP